MKQYLAGLVLILGIIGFIFVGEWATAEQEAPEKMTGKDLHVQAIQPTGTDNITLYKMTDRKDGIVCYNVYIKNGLDIKTAISCVKK